MLVSNVAPLGLCIIVSVMATTAPTIRWESEASVLYLRSDSARQMLLGKSPFLTGACFKVPAVVFAISSSVSRIFARSWILGIFVCEGYVARVLHAEHSSNLLMEPASNFVISFLGILVNLLIQAHWGDTDSCWSGYPSGTF